MIAGRVVGWVVGINEIARKRDIAFEVGGLLVEAL